jgi:citrate synthase
MLHLIRTDSNYTREEVEMLDLLMVVHAEHGGGNNSSFATHVVSSSGTDTYSAMATAIGALKGPKHGGANLMVASMFEEIRKNVSNWENEAELKEYLARILDKKAFDGKGLIYGMGHAVYTLSDPRTVLLKQKAQELSRHKGLEREYNLISDVERISSKLIQEKTNKDYAPSANVDMYSGFVFDMLGIPRDLFTPIFAVSRIAGWSAHRLEQILDDKIMRPAYVNLSELRPYTPIDDRMIPSGE